MGLNFKYQVIGTLRAEFGKLLGFFSFWTGVDPHCLPARPLLLFSRWVSRCHADHGYALNTPGHVTGSWRGTNSQVFRVFTTLLRMPREAKAPSLRRQACAVLMPGWRTEGILICSRGSKLLLLRNSMCSLF